MPSHLTILHTSPFINENDNTKNILKWLKSGEFTPKLFAKHLPHTAQDISQGLKDGGSVCKQLLKGYVWDAKGDNCNHLRTLAMALGSVILPKGSPEARYILCVRVSAMLYTNSHRPEECGSLIDTQMSLIDAIKGIRDYFLSDEGMKMMDERFFKGMPAGSFRRESPCAILNEKQFSTSVHSRLLGGMNAEELWRECEHVRQIGIVLSRLTGAYHFVLHKCWNCNKAVDTLLHCGKCESAIYCSRQCQVAAWKGGHKRKCGRLKLLQKRFEQGDEELDRAHFTGKIDGFELSLVADMELLLHCIVHNLHNLPRNPVPADMAATGKKMSPAEMEATGTKVKPDGPSMQYFYENLGRIIRGEWLPCDLSEQEGDADDEETTPPDRLSEILRFLAFDWFGLGKTFGIDDPIEITSLADPLFRRECGPPISAAKILDLYRSSCSERIEYRPDQKVSLQATIRRLHDDMLK